jgi:ABC-2 type transport system permease protein
MKGSLLLLYALALVFCLSTLSLGILISTLAGTQLQAFFVGQFVMIFAMMLSGFFTPVENISPAIRVLSYLNPVRYFISILREIYLKGTEFQFLWKEAAAMGIIGMVALLAAAMRFQRRLK